MYIISRDFSWRHAGWLLQNVIEVQTLLMNSEVYSKQLVVPLNNYLLTLLVA